MKKTMRYISMAALALMGAITAGCSSDDSIEQQLEKGGAVALKTTVSLGDGDITRALSADGSEKTFAVGDKIAIVYENENKDGQTVKAESDALTADDIATGGKTATFSVVLTSPKASGSVKYIYPAAKANNDGTVNNSALATQDGTMAYIGENCDVALFEGSMTSEARLPAQSTLTNQLAICAFTIYNADGSSDITSTITAMTVSDGTNSYAVSRTAAAGPIYVAIKPVANATIEYTATDGTAEYAKSVTGKTYSAGDLLPINLKMAPVVTATDLSMLDCAGNARSSMTTANCYMVHTAGQYKLPLVYGNAIKGGEDNTVAYKPGGTTSDTYCANFVNHAGTAITAPWIKDNGIAVTKAKLLWQDAQGLITAVGISGDYLTLTVGKDATDQEGNAVVAAMTSDSTIVWSWHIWVTKQTFANLTEVAATVTDNNNNTSYTYKLTPVNLGWVGDATSATGGYNTYYQWGRKDAFIPSNPIPPTGTANTKHTVYGINNNDVTKTAFTHTTDNSVTIGGNIQHPTVHYYNSSGPCKTKYYNMWDAQQTSNAIAAAATAKTVYDPCPPGFCVPTIGLYNYIINQNEPTWNTGYTYPATNGVFFPASGYRNYNVDRLAGVGTYGYCWSATPGDGTNKGRGFTFISGRWFLVSNNRALGCPVRAVAE